MPFDFLRSEKYEVPRVFDEEDLTEGDWIIISSWISRWERMNGRPMNQDEHSIFLGAVLTGIAFGMKEMDGFRTGGSDGRR